MRDEMRLKRLGRPPGSLAVRWAVGRKIAFVVVARVSRGRERLGVAVAVSRVPMVLCACGRRGRWVAFVAPYIVTGGLVRRREVVGFEDVDVDAESVALGSGAKFCCSVFVNAMSCECI